MKFIKKTLYFETNLEEIVFLQIPKEMAVEDGGWATSEGSEKSRRAIRQGD